MSYNSCSPVHQTVYLSRRKHNQSIVHQTSQCCKLTVVFISNDSDCLVRVRTSLSCRLNISMKRVNESIYTTRQWDQDDTYSISALSDQNSTLKLSLPTGRGCFWSSVVKGITPPSTQSGTCSSPLAKARNVGARSWCALTRLLTWFLRTPGPRTIKGTLKWFM